MKVELICFLYNKKLAEMEVKHDDILAKVTIDTERIESVRERSEYESEEVDKGTCMVHMKSGDSFQIGKSYEEMINIWNDK